MIHTLLMNVTRDHLLAEDLDKTVEAPGERMSSKLDIDLESGEQGIQVCF